MLLSKARSILPALLAILAPAPGAPLPAALPARPPSHVVVVIEAGRDLGDLVGSSAAPYLNGLAKAGALMPRSFALPDPGGPGTPERPCAAPDLGALVAAAGGTFAGYREDPPAAGPPRPDPRGGFCTIPAAWDRPFSVFPQGHFQDLPTIAVVAPEPGRELGDGAIQAADAWLRDRLDGYVRWAAGHDGLLILTAAGDGGARSFPTLFLGPMVQPGSCAGPITGANVLRTLEDLYGLARTTDAAPITGIWTGPPAAPAATLTITASAGAHGTITPGGSVSVAAGANQTFNMDAAAGYAISSVVVDGADQGPICAYTFGNVTTGHSITAGFSAPNQYIITASAGPGGSISPSGAVPLAGGASQTFTITPAAGYAILAVTVDGAAKGALPSYTFSNVMANHAIGATFSAPVATGKVISVDFAGKAAAMAAGEVAGVYPRANWNSAQGAVQGTPQALVDETGAATGATLAWSASGVWSLPATGASGDLHMMAGYLDAVGANTIVRVAGLPANAAGYDVLVYADGDNGSATRAGIYQVSGSGVATTNIKLTDPANTNFTGSYQQASGSSGNYVRFTVTATAFNLTAIPSTSSDGYPRAPINGIQIVPSAGPAAP